MYELIPDELKTVPNWVCWRADPDPKSHSGVSKKPINPKTGGMAQSNNPDTWCDFDTAVMKSVDYAGIGFMFSNSPYFGVDIDDIKEQVEEFKGFDCDNNIIAQFVDALKTYTEESQSGNGVHMICRGELPTGKRRKGKIEMYDSGRFFVMTGKNISKHNQIADCTETIKPLHRIYLGEAEERQKCSAPIHTAADYSEDEIIEKIRNSRQRYKFDSLYGGDISGFPSHSEADQALCNLLAFWCQRDTSKMDRIFRQSGLMRDKWDRRIGNSTYGQKTLSRAAEDCREIYEASTEDDYYITIKPKVPEEYKCVIVHKRYTLDDTGNANMMYDACGNAYRYCYTDKKWLYFNGGKWSYDCTGEIYKTIDETISQMSTLDDLYSPTLSEEDEGYKEQQKIFDAWNKHKKKSRSHSAKSATEKEFQYRVSIEPRELDGHPEKVNFKNCTLDLKTMKTSNHDIKDYITKIIDIDYHADSPEPLRWIQFLNDIFGNNHELINYIQKSCGYCLSGSTAEQCVFFLFGNGRNGKSTFLEVVRGILGDYATNIQPSTIMVKKNGSSGANSDVARLKGARLVTSVEPNEGDRLDEGLIKQITGGDVVTARKLYGDEFEFCPEFKLWMATNHKPVIRGRDMGIWRRIHLIPFTVTIPDEKVDRNLKTKLAEEKESILKWMVDGYVKWRREGLSLPSCMVAATNDYKHEMDSIASFIDACCVVEEGAVVNATELFSAYRRWAIDNNEYDMSSTKFGRELNKKYNKVKDQRGRMAYQGIRIGDKSNDYHISIGNN